jgi:prolyl 4-hydroxylase
LNFYDEQKGRPFPLKGRFMANIFVHFEPVGSLTDPTTDKRQFAADLPPYLLPGTFVPRLQPSQSFSAFRKRSMENLGTCLYVVTHFFSLKGSEEETYWRRTHPNGWRATRGNSHDSGSTEAHILAKQRNAVYLNRALDTNPKLVHARDANGWTALHEAVRSACFDCVVNLLQRGADVNARTTDGRSPLHHAKLFDKGHQDSSKIYQFLQRHGGTDFGPEL